MQQTDAFLVRVQGERRQLGSSHVAAAAAVEAERESDTDDTESDTPFHAPAASMVRVEVPQFGVQFGEHLRLVGSCAELGSWNAQTGAAMSWREGHDWIADVALPPGRHDFKVVVMRGDGSQQWEDGSNRQLSVPQVAAAGKFALHATCRFGATADTEVEQLLPPPPVSYLLAGCWRGSLLAGWLAGCCLCACAWSLRTVFPSCCL